MSTSGPGAREVAYRLFGAEFDDATLSYSESDEERAPNYVVTPTGARVNRLFVVGVLTEVERINEDTRRGRVVDPSGAFVTYAGQYQPEAQAFLERTTPPTFVALTGKARTFEPEDSDRVYTSVRPESINEVDADTRDRWIVTAAETTLDRLAVFKKAMASDLRGDDLRTALQAGGAPEALAAGIPHALDHYRTSPAYVEAIRQLAVDALEMVAGERDEVRSPEFGPDAGGDAEIGPLPETDVTVDEAAVDLQTETDTPEPAAEGSDVSETDVSETDVSETDVSETDVSETGVDDSSRSETSIDDTETEKQKTDEPSVATETTDSPTELDGMTDGEAEHSSSDDGGPGEFQAAAESGSGSEIDDAAAETTAASEPEGLGDFDAGGDSTESDTDAGDGESVVAAGSEGEMYELDEEERNEVEEEFGTEFSTGGEVEEAGIDVPDADELAEEMEDSEGAQPGTEDATEQEPEAEPEAVPEPETEGTGSEDEAADSEADDGEPAGTEPDPDVDLDDVDLTDVAVETMKELDDGDGADHDAVVAAVVDEYGADPGDVEEAIQDALMGGQCYEPGEGTLKAI